MIRWLPAPGAVRTTLLKFTNYVVTINDTPFGQNGHIKIIDFPPGVKGVLGAMVLGSLTAGVTGTIKDGWSGSVSMGMAPDQGDQLIMPNVAFDVPGGGKVGTIDPLIMIYDTMWNMSPTWHDESPLSATAYVNFNIADDPTHTAGTAHFTGHVSLLWVPFGGV